MPSKVQSYLCAGGPILLTALRADPQLRAELGANGRAYAERAFNRDRITDTFEEVLSGAAETARSGKSWAAYRNSRSWNRVGVRGCDRQECVTACAGQPRPVGFRL